MTGRKYHYEWDGNSLTVNGVEFRHVRSDLGDVWVSANGTAITNGRADGRYRGIATSGNYLKVSLGRRKVSMHVLVYELFVERIPDGLDIDHINGDPTDNRAENLRAVSKSANMRNPITKVRLKRSMHRFQPLAAKAVMRRVYGVSVETGKKIGPFESLAEAERRTGVGHQCIAHCASGYRNRKTAGGYRWLYC